MTKTNQLKIMGNKLYVLVENPKIYRVVATHRNQEQKSVLMTSEHVLPKVAQWVCLKYKNIRVEEVIELGQISEVFNLDKFEENHLVEFKEVEE